MKRVILSVTNDLSTDQRVDKVARSLQKMGFQVVLIGRLLPESVPLRRDYPCHRMKLWFRKGALFYAEYNLRLFFLLMTTRADIHLANDLDTLLANYLAAKLKKRTLVYDSHEYYTEVPELKGRKHVQKFWLRIEQWIFPKLKYVYTVNQSIARIYEDLYRVPVKVVRNLPESEEIAKILCREELGLPTDKFIVILQGSGINIDRGGEELVEAMAYLPECFLVIVGSGDVIEQLKSQSKIRKLSGRILFRPKMPYDEMMQYTLNADLGVTLDKDTNLNYRYSLPNKIFDYMKAGIPVLSSNLPELRRIIEEYQIGTIVTSHNPEEIARAIERVRSNPVQCRQWSENTKFAKSVLNWQNQEEVLASIFRKFV